MFEIEVPPQLSRYTAVPRVALVLGSGFGGLADTVEDAEKLAYATIDGFPRPAAGVAGHAGTLVFGAVAGVPVCVFSGRVHRYQGVSRARRRVSRPAGRGARLRDARRHERGRRRDRVTPRG